LITATPPAYYQEIDSREIKHCPRGASDDSGLLEEFSSIALRSLISTPGHTSDMSEEYFLAGDLDDYISPGLKRIGTKRVKVIYRGSLKPMPFEEESDW